MWNNSEIKEIMIGSLLGNLHIERSKWKNKEGSIIEGNSRLLFKQEDTNVEYLMWIWKKFSSNGFVSTKKPKLYIRISKNNKVRYYYKLNSYSFVELNNYYNRFYISTSSGEKNIKVVPKDLDKDFTSLSLAVWFMDDGCISGEGLKLNTNKYKKEEVEYLSINILKNLFNIVSSVNKLGNKDQYIIYIHKESKKEFIKLISSHLTEGMKDRKKK